MPITAELEAIKAFQKLEQDYIAKTSGAVLDVSKNEFKLDFCNDRYRVSYPTGEVSFLYSETEVPELVRTIILQYMAFASGLPPRGHWLSFLELPNGSHHNQPFELEACQPLAETFGAKPEAFLKIGEQFGGERLGLGDASFRLKILPKLDLAFVLWEGDDEFPPAAKVLFEGVSPTYMTTAWLYCLGIEVAVKLRGAL